MQRPLAALALVFGMAIALAVVLLYTADRRAIREATNGAPPAARTAEQLPPSGGALPGGTDSGARDAEIAAVPSVPEGSAAGGSDATASAEAEVAVAPAGVEGSAGADGTTAAPAEADLALLPPEGSAAAGGDAARSAEAETALAPGAVEGTLDAEGMAGAPAEADLALAPEALSGAAEVESADATSAEGAVDVAELPRSGEGTPASDAPAAAEAAPEAVQIATLELDLAAPAGGESASGEMASVTDVASAALAPRTADETGPSPEAAAGVMAELSAGAIVEGSAVPSADPTIVAEAAAPDIASVPSAPAAAGEAPGPADTVELQLAPAVPGGSAVPEGGPASRSEARRTIAAGETAEAGALSGEAVAHAAATIAGEAATPALPGIPVGEIVIAEAQTAEFFAVAEAEVPLLSPMEALAANARGEPLAAPSAAGEPPAGNASVPGLAAEAVAGTDGTIVAEAAPRTGDAAVPLTGDAPEAEAPMASAAPLELAEAGTVRGEAGTALADGFAASDAGAIVPRIGIVGTAPAGDGVPPVEESAVAAATAGEARPAIDIEAVEASTLTIAMAAEQGDTLVAAQVVETEPVLLILSAADRVVAAAEAAGELPHAVDTAIAAAQASGSANGAGTAAGTADVADLAIRAAEAEDGTLFVAGEAPEGATVRVFANEVLVGEARAGSEGTWLLEADSEIPLGVVVLSAEAEGAAGAASPSPAQSAFMRFPDGIVLEPLGPEAGEEREMVAALGWTPQPTYVIIRRGDNLWRIARRNYGRGIRYHAIVEANRDRITNPHWIFPGQVFVIPQLQGQPEVATN
jgi:nucleoid-associated protein YgaU